MAKSDKMYKDTPKMERNKEGKMGVKKPSEKEEKEAPENTGTDGMEVHVKDMHERHANELKDMHKRHEKEHKAIMEKHGAKESGEGEKVEKGEKAKKD